MVMRMILNNHGLGLKQLILCGTILLLALFFVSFSISQLSNEFKDAFKNSITGSNTYSSIEENIRTSALFYMKEYYKSEIGFGTITVTTDKLIEYSILNNTDLEINSKDICKGYALVKKEKDFSLKTEAYITCKHYETENYQSWRLGE